MTWGVIRIGAARPEPQPPTFGLWKRKPGSERRHALPESTAALEPSEPLGPLRSPRSFPPSAALPLVRSMCVCVLSGPLAGHSQVVLVPANPRGPRTMPGGDWHLVNTCGVMDSGRLCLDSHRSSWAWAVGAFSTATARRRARTVPSLEPGPLLTWGRPGTRSTRRATPSLMPGGKQPCSEPGGQGRPANRDPDARGRDVLREGPGRPRSQSRACGLARGRTGEGGGAGRQLTAAP